LERISVDQLRAQGGWENLLKDVLRPSKYRNNKSAWKGLFRGRDQEIKFDSQKEMNRFLELKRDPSISELSLQERFILTHKSHLEKASYYVADFVYKRDGKWYVEDVKGMKTDTYILKRKMFKMKYPTMIFIES